MAKTTVVRVDCPPELSPADFLAVTRAWLDHQCIMVADFRSIARAGDERVFDAEFDNPRDARLFARRFGAEPIYPHRRARNDHDLHLSALFQFWRKAVAKAGARPVAAWPAAEAPAE